MPQPKVKFECEFVAESREPIRGSSGPFIVATKTFDEVSSKQFDIILVPAGPPSLHAESIPKAVAKFIRDQVPEAKYVLSVCGGSWTLATLGLLDGKRATSNKSMFNQIKATTNPTIQWVAKARWVVDGKLWTSSGVTAGQDMAYEFLKTVAGVDFAAGAKNAVELRATGADDDEFAEVFGLA
nr:putative ThiJ/DJ-1 [Rhizoctonia solani]